jgi:pectin methylesterase-like acyl-CoA thioesterase
MGKNAITLQGEDRKDSIIAYPNNAAFNDGGGNPYAGNPAPVSPVHAHGIYHRSVFLAHRCEDLKIENLTIRNTTPARGSQEEALILNGTLGARAILRNLDLCGHQDTLQVNGQAYVTGCRIEGDVDFMWGTGPCFFDNCVCRSLRSTNAYYTQVRNPASNHGFVYRQCTFDGLPGVTESFLSRIAASRFPHSEVVLIDCALGPSVAPAGWLLQKGPNGEAGDPSGLHFWEFHSHDLAGKPANVRSRLSVSRQLRLPEDAQAIADFGNPAYVLGGGWNPRMAP